jgi:O-antigen ligase
MSEAELAFAALPGLIAVGIWAVRNVERFVYVAVLPAMTLAPLTLLRPGGAQVATADILMIVAFGAWVVSLAARGARKPDLTQNYLLVSLAAFVGVNAASVAWSDQLPDTLKMIVQLTQIVLLFPILFASLPRDLRTIKTGFIAFILASTGLSVLALIAAAPDLAAGQFNAVELGFGLGNKNAAGSSIAAGFVMSYILLFGALVAITACGVMLQRGRFATVITTVAALSLYFAVVAPQAEERRSDAAGAYDSTDVRTASFEGAIEKIKADPILGSGSGTYEDYLPEFAIGLPDPNNMFLLTWAETGLIGMAALLFLLLRFGRTWVRTARHVDQEARVLGVTAGGVAVSLLVHWQFDVTWTRGTSSLAFAAMGVMIAVLRLGDGSSRRIRLDDYQVTERSTSEPRTHEAAHFRTA